MAANRKIMLLRHLADKKKQYEAYIEVHKNSPDKKAKADKVINRIDNAVAKIKKELLEETQAYVNQHKKKIEAEQKAAERRVRKERRKLEYKREMEKIRRMHRKVDPHGPLTWCILITSITVIIATTLAWLQGMI